MRRNILNVLCVIGAPLFESTLAPRRSIAFRNSAGTWSRAPGKQFGVLDRWRDRHTRPARWSDTLRIRPVRWRKWNRIRIDLARLADPTGHLCGEFTGPRWIPRTKASDAQLWCFLLAASEWTVGWVNNGEAGDLSRYGAHYDVIVMCQDLLPGRNDSYIP